MSISLPLAAQTEDISDNKQGLESLLVPGYRVEILVVRHLNGSSDRSPVQWLTDYSDALDLLSPPTDEDESARDNANNSASSSAHNPGAVTDVDLKGGPSLPAALRVEERSEAMAQAWRRLKLSAGFRPELYLAWQQGDSEDFPVIRIHDDEILLESQPAYGTQNDSVEGTLAAVPTYSDANTSLDGDRIALDEVVEEPVYFYRIDGTARLRRSRFLHLVLSIEYREPIEQEFARPGLANNALPMEPVGKRILSTSQTTEPANPTTTEQASGSIAYRVHTINQQRQVRSQELEYFDGPVIGVIAYITRIEAEEEPVSAVSELDN